MVSEANLKKINNRSTLTYEWKLIVYILLGM